MYALVVLLMAIQVKMFSLQTVHIVYIYIPSITIHPDLTLVEGTTIVYIYGCTYTLITSMVCHHNRVLTLHMII
jgi:hypothetical protein